VRSAFLPRGVLRRDDHLPIRRDPRFGVVTQDSPLREYSSFSQYACGDLELGVVKRRRGDAKLLYYTGKTFLVQGPGAFDALDRC
jgi:hypothetical protein